MTADCSELAPDTLGLVLWLGRYREDSHSVASRSAREVLVCGMDIGRDTAVFLLSVETNALCLQRLCPTLFPRRLCLAIRFSLRHRHSQVQVSRARYIALRILSRNETCRFRVPAESV